MSAPTPRAGSSGRWGKSGSSPNTTAAASAGSVPGIEPIAVAAPLGQSRSLTTADSGRPAADGGDRAAAPGRRDADIHRISVQGHHEQVSADRLIGHDEFATATGLVSRRAGPPSTPLVGRPGLDRQHPTGPPVPA